LNNALELAKAAMKEAVALHVAMEKERFALWKASPAKGRKPFVPFADNEAICRSMEDLFSTGVDLVRKDPNVP